MGKWDAELIDLLPTSVKVFASAGAGFDWADTQLLGEKGEYSDMVQYSSSSDMLTKCTRTITRHHLLQLRPRSR